MLTLRRSWPFYTGAATSDDFLGRWDVVLNGRPYMIDTRVSAYTGHSEFMEASVPLIRNQADAASSPSEASINPNDLWRRSQDTWHKGAGQSYLDRADSDPARFHASKGVDVWDKWELSLLPDTDQKRASVNTNLALVAAGGYLYYIDGQVIRRTADITPDSPTWTTITGGPAATLLSITTDGYTIYVTDGSDIYSGTRGGASVSSWSTYDADVLGYVKGRLMAAKANLVFNITGAATKTDIVTQANTDFAWVGFAEGPGHIFMAGFSGDKSLIYKTAIKADGTALDAGSVAGELPDGEIVRSIQGYLGLLLIGTDKGVRVAAIDTDGNLTIGSLIPTTSAVKCFEPQDRFCWYGLTDYDSTSTGLGRLDLSVLTNPLTPAYASDLMVTGSGAVLSVVTFQGLRVFAVSGLGVYAETTTLVASGTIDSGQITYRLPDKKVAMFVDVRHDGVGSHSVALSVDGGSFATIGGTHTASDDPFPAGQQSGIRFEVRTTLTTVAGVGPAIRAITLRSYPTTSTVKMITVPLILHELVTLHDDSEHAMDPEAERDEIEALRASRELVTWQQGRRSESVIVDDFEWRPVNQMHDFSGWNGTLVASLKAIE